MLQTNLNVIAVGEPNFDVLTDSEKRSFFETLFSRIVEIHKKKQTEATSSKCDNAIQRFTDNS